MKNIEILKYNFNQLIEKLIEEKSRLSLPAYQREYSWDIKNWKELFDDIKEIIKTNRKNPTEEKPNIWFIGSIIFQKKSDGVGYDIIDGQQRLITFFILLITIYSVIPIDQDKKRIRQFLFYDWYEDWTRDKSSLLQDSLRIELDNPDDQKDLRNIIPLYPKPDIWPSPREERKRNIIRAKDFFVKEVNEENYCDVYQTILDNFYFSLITLDKETDSEIFMTLNTAGEDLAIPDLVKSLLTRRNDYQARQFAAIWEEKVVKKICFPPASKKNRSDKVKRFLIVFWEVQENNCYNRTLDDKILRFYRKKIKGDRKTKTQEENREFLDLLVKYTEVYEKVINADNHCEWWEQNWSEEMFKIVQDIFLLDRKELVSLILAAHFQFKEKTSEEKLAITKELKKLVLYIFRAIIIKGKVEDENALRAIRINTLKMLSAGQTLLFGQEKYPVDLIIQEFQGGSESFYQTLQGYRNKKNKELRIEKFILLTYYQKKIKDKGLKVDWFSYDIKPLISQNSEFEEVGENRNSIGNLTLVKVRDDQPLFPWDEKRLIYKQMGDNCLLNFEEENWTEAEDIIDLIAERKKYLTKDFKKLRIFEPD